MAANALTVREATSPLASPRQERVVPLSSARPVPAGWAHPEPMASTTREATTESTNWSGYVATGQSADFTEASGSWTVPEVQPGPAGYSSSWVGIDGTSTQDLIQAGTEQDWGPQGVVYYAWYEVLPADSMYLGPVYPGDRVSVSIAKVGNASWTIDVRDMTHGTLWTGAVSYTAPGNSAEWVEEAPTNGQSYKLYPLADFGTVQFSSLQVEGPGTGAATVSPVYMVKGTTGKVEAYPARYSAASDSFSVEFGEPASGPTGWPSARLGAATPLAGSSGTSDHSSNPTPAAPAQTAPLVSPRPGYWLVAGDGGVFAFGSAEYAGSTAAVFAGSKTAGVTGVAAAPGGRGYWLVTATGGVFPLGGAKYLGSVSSLNLSAGTNPAIAASPTGEGYYILAPWGDVFAFGSARFEGSCDRARCGPSQAVALVPDTTGRGYWMVLSDCRVVAFGDARPLANQACLAAAGASGPAAGGAGTAASEMAGAPAAGRSLGLGLPGGETGTVVATGRTPEGNGFWALLGNGAVYPEGDATDYGDWVQSAMVTTPGSLSTDLGPSSAQSVGPASPPGAGSPGPPNPESAVAIVPTSDGGGAWVVRANGTVEALGDAPALGGLPDGAKLNQPVLSAVSS